MNNVLVFKVKLDIASSFIDQIDCGAVHMNNLHH